MKRGLLYGALASWLLIAPVPLQPKPHLVEKWEMFQAGTLTHWLDMVDVAWHLAPFTILCIVFVRHQILVRKAEHE